MPRSGISGGRLLALTMAESLAATGVEVDFIVDHSPEMHREFSGFSRVRLISSWQFWNLRMMVDRTVDVVVIVPSIGKPFQHRRWLQHALACDARVVLLNFESPNWFNSLSPSKRDEKLWGGWNRVSRKAHLIMSISKEGDKYARQYYSGAPAGCLFDHCYPGINTVAADRACQPLVRKKQIVMLTRVDSHKGTTDLEPLLDETLAGYTLVLCLGNGSLPPETLSEWRQRFNRVGMDIEVRQAVSGVEKYQILKESQLLYFPTRFEGFGLPPLEAAYCLLPCACSDLPVLREFGGVAFCYGDPGVTESMRSAVLRALESGDRVAAEHARISRIARMEEWGRRQLCSWPGRW